MPFLQPSIEGSSSPIQDPWDWTVDQVIFAFTDPRSPLLTSNPSLSLPDPHEFADILRKDGTTGHALFCEMKENDLRDELGIKSRGHRASINHMIRLLQDRSAQYQQYQQYIVATGRASSIGTVSRMGTPLLASPQHFQLSYNPRFSGILHSPAAPAGEFKSLPVINGDFGPSVERQASLGLDVPAGPPPLPRPDWRDFQTLGKADGLGMKSMEVDGGQSEVGDMSGCNDASGIFSDEILDTGQSTLQSEQRTRQVETKIIDEGGRKRRRLVLGPVDVPSTTEPNNAQSTAVEGSPGSPSTLRKDSDDGHPIYAIPQSDIESPILQEGGSLTATRTVDMPTEADSTIPDSQEKVAEPGALTIGTDGRKRMRPILLTQPERNIVPIHPDQVERGTVGHNATSSAPSIPNVGAALSFTQRSYGRTANRTEEQIYLGPRPLPVDELFYGDSPFETKLDIGERSDSSRERDDFTSALFASSGRGLSIYVNARMKYFLQSKSVSLNRGGPKCKGIVPYPSRIGRRHYPLSMTIFSWSSDGISVLRSNRSKWVEDDSARARRISGEETSNAFNVADPSLAQDDGNDHEWKVLEKWKYMDGQDEILPLYGESGSEGEYELDTWKEMEIERGELARPMGRSNSLKLTAEQVDEAIETAIKQSIEEWTVKRKPKLQQKAWRLWVKSRREHNAKARIDHFTDETHRLEARLASLRKEIAMEEWSKPSEISKQCKSMQPSIFALEDDKWKIATLTLSKVPEKPPPAIRKARDAEVQVLDGVLNDDEENLMTDDDTSETSELSLEDFIVDDDVDADDYQPVIVDDDLTMADIEDTVDSDTLVGGKEHHGSAMPEITPKVEPGTQGTEKRTIEAHRSTPKPPVIVDLTLDSDPVEPVPPLNQPKSSFAIKTPPLHSSENDSDVFQRSRSRKKVFKMLPLPKPASVINLETDSAESTAIENSPTAKKVLPPLSDVDSIRAMDPTELVERQDRKRLLIWMIAHAPLSRRNGASVYLTKVSAAQSRSDITLGLKRLREYKQSMRGWEKERSDALLAIASWHVCWTIPVKAEPSGLITAHIDITLKTLRDDEGYESFYDVLLECLSHYRTAPIPLDCSMPIKKRQRIIREGTDDDNQYTPIRKRKYVVQESQGTLDKRQAAQDRMRGDEERRRREELKSRFKPRDSNNAGTSKVIVNPGKLEDQDFIYLNPEFGNGAKIQPHQEQGLQFLWREITAEPEDPQGCLLAQTMGLGKTMQAIALLVTLSEAAQSPNKNIRHQVPRHLRKSCTLVLCPPALLENWWDEFLIWLPKHSSKCIGELRKVSVSFQPLDRLGVIQAWSNNGGILLIGYDTFKNLIHNPSRTEKKSMTKKAALDDDQHERVKEALLKRANLVIADEAHSFKCKLSKLNSAMTQIGTRSRIALTGSPLNNNLQEYYTIIDWIAPNYLGTYPEFKATYEEPIREGLYHESTISQYRESRKRLKALELEMEPKVHRANNSVLHNALKGKMEFVVKVPLTKLQEEVYRIYVDSIRSATSGQEPEKASLWCWLGVLQLLCNHPKCFNDQILTVKADLANGGRSRASTSKKPPDPNSIDEGLLGSDEDGALLAEPPAQFAFSRIVDECEKYFQAVVEPLDALCLSNKMQILMNILKFANAAREKVLVFSHRIATLDYIEEQLTRDHESYARIDGKSAAQKRQQITKSFNEGNVNVCLISTRAGGTGLNLYGANRVVILDEHFNPAWELQAIGRAYRIGQQKPVYVYRLTAGGTFEQEIQNQALFKEQLANRVVDKKNPNRSALRGAGSYLVPPTTLQEEDVSQYLGHDPIILDRLLADRTQNRIISITPSETFHVEDGVELTAAEREEAEQMQKTEQLRRRDPKAYYAREGDRKMRQVQHTAMPPSKIGTWTNGRPGTQPVHWHAPNNIHLDLGLPPSTAPTMTANMGGLPYTDASSTGLTSLSTAPHGVNLAPISLSAERVRPPTLRELQLVPPVDQLGRLTDVPPSMELVSSNQTLSASSKANGTNSSFTPRTKGIDNEADSLKKMGTKGARTPGGMLSYMLEADTTDLSDAVQFAEIALSAPTSPEKREHVASNRKEQVQGKQRGSSDDTNRKHGLPPGEESNPTKRMKPTPMIDPNFKGEGPTEAALTELLRKCNART